jgi:serine/threonine protein kinase
MLCGRPPFEAPQSNEVLAMHIHNNPPSPREFAPHREITEMAEAVILRAMQKDAGRRYQNMSEFRRDLANAYGSISYRRHGAPVPGLTPRGEEARITKKRLTEELDEWITGDASSLSLEQARMLSLVETAEKAFTPTAMSPQEAERLASALDRALEDDD